jgi:hypothetical protein
MMMGLKRLYTHRILHDKPDAAHDYEVYDALATDTLLQQLQELADAADKVALSLEHKQDVDNISQAAAIRGVTKPLREIIEGSKKV